MPGPRDEIPYHRFKRQWAEKEKAEADSVAAWQREQQAEARETTNRAMAWLGALSTLLGVVGVVIGVFSWSNEAGDRRRDRAMSRLAYIEQRAKILSSGDRAELVESPALLEVLEVLAANGDPIELGARERIVLRDVQLPCGRYLLRAPQVYLSNVSIDGSAIEAEADRLHIIGGKIRGSELTLLDHARPPAPTSDAVDPTRPVAPIMLTNSQLDDSTFRFRAENPSVRNTKLLRSKFVLDSPGRDFLLEFQNFEMNAPLYPNPRPEGSGGMRPGELGFFKKPPDLAPTNSDIATAAPLSDWSQRSCKPAINQSGYICTGTSSITPLVLPSDAKAKPCPRRLP